MKKLFGLLFLFTCVGYAGPIFDNLTVEGNTTLSGLTAGGVLRLDGSKIITSTPLTTSIVTEGSNLYYTSARFDSAFAAKSTTDLAEGSNLYFTNLRAYNAVVPTQTGNAGKFLTTDGTNISWAAISSGGFPILAPNSAITNGYCFAETGNDTCIGSTGDGIISVQTNGVIQLTFATGGSGTNTFSNTITAPDFIYPAKTANTVLAGPTSGSPATPSFRALAFGDIGNNALPSPIVLGVGGGLGSDGIQWDSDTAILSPGDGEIDTYANGVKTLTVTPGLLGVTGDLAVSGNISAANYPPTGTANTFAGYSALGSLYSLPNWNFNPDANTMGVYGTYDIFSVGNLYHNMEIAPEITDDYVGSSNGWNYDYHFDRNNTGKNLDGNMTPWQLSVRNEGSGTMTGVFRGMGLFQNMGANSAKADSIEGFGIFMDLQAGNEVVNARVLNLDLDGEPGTITNNATVINFNTRNSFDNDLIFLGGNNGNASTVGRDFRFFQLGNDGDVDNNFGGSLLFQNGKTAENFAGYFISLNNDTGTVGHNNYGSGYDFNINSGHVVEAGGNAFNFSNGSPFTGNSGGFRWNGVNINNQGAGGSFGGVSVYDGGAMVDEKRGFQYSAQGNARTGTGLDIHHEGTYTDDVQGGRINMNNAVSTTNHVDGLEIQMGNATGPQGIHSLTAEGGTMMVNSAGPTLQAGFNIGNYFSETQQLTTPVTGSEYIQQIFQSNLFFGASMTAFPFGLGVTGVGIVNQTGVDAAVTQPYYRAFLFGASNPQGAGNLTEYVAGEILGMQSFGGATVVGSKVGLQDANVFGAGFCNGSADCWVYRAQDDTADNYFAKSITIGGTTKKSAAGVGLELDGNKHIRFTADDPPTGSVNANAGTGAGCAVNGTDSASRIEISTGSGAWAAGSQCDVTFLQPFTNTPICTLAPAADPGNEAYADNAAMSAVNTSIVRSSTGYSIRFRNADIAATTYRWDVICVETN